MRLRPVKSEPMRDFYLYDAGREKNADFHVTEEWSARPPPLRGIDDRTCGRGAGIAPLLFAGILLVWALIGAPLAALADAPVPVEPNLVIQPLAHRPRQTGKTMFVPMSPEETGVKTENNYDDPDMWGRRYAQLSIGAIGCGVAIGDYDGDGRPDIFVVSKTGSCRLFRNLGGFKFQDVTDKAGVGDKGDAAKIWKEGACFVDVNNDGLLDIYVCRFDAPNLLYINQGDGTFKEEAHAYGLDVKDACVMADFCDYDRDGWPDVFIQTNLLDNDNHPSGQRDYLFHNNRNGTFTDVTQRAGVAPRRTRGNSAMWWDYDNDGWPDLYVANDFAEPDALYHNNRDGTFTNVINKVVPHVPYSAMGSDTGDFDNNGQIDLMVTDMAATDHVEDQRAMAVTRARDRDPADNSTEVVQYLRSALFLNTGTGRCLEAANLAGLSATDWTWSPRWEDLDNDGRLDLFVTNGMFREVHNADLIEQTMSAESDSQRISMVRSSPVFAEKHLSFRNLGNLRFQNVSTAWGLDQTGVGFGSAFGDLEGDGNLDIIYTNYDSGVTLLRNECDSGHRVMIALRGVRSNRFGLGTKVILESASGRQASVLTSARGYMSSSDPVLHFGLGADDGIKHLTLFWPSGQVQRFDNLPADRRFIITEPSGPLPPPAAYLEKPPHRQFIDVSRESGFSWRSHEDTYDELLDQRLLPVRFNRRGPALAVGDLNGSGNEGVAIGGTTLDATRLLVAGKPAVFQPLAVPLLASPPAVDDGPLLLFDAAGKGRTDLLITRGGASEPDGADDYQPELLLNDGHGHFNPAPEGALPPLPISVGAVAAADFEHNGRLGLFIGGRVSPGEYPRAPRSALLSNQGGKFVDVTDRLAPQLRNVGMVTAALWTDVDADGWPDLLVALEWGQVRYFHNDQGHGFSDWTEKAGFASAGTGWWTSLAAADFNGDGRPDYVAGNVGLNTQYHADPKHPALLYSGHFSPRGRQELIEAYYEGDKLYPWRDRQDLGAAIPSILRRYPTNDAYAKAQLPDLIGAARLAAATRYPATELRSGVFLSQPDGTYRFEPLPRLAQIAPFQGVVAGDFNGDGHADIYAVQNSYAPAPVVGRFDGGLSQLLLGDGHGHFTLVPPAESGLIVPGDAKALAVLDLDKDGWPDFLITRNNNTTLAFRNGGVAGRHSLRILLQGPPGNPTCVGARVTLQLADGSTQVSEVYAGSGYFSQSSPAVFFGYPDGNPPQKVNVRWPSGNTTSQEIAVLSPTLTLPGPKP